MAREFLFRHVAATGGYFLLDVFRDSESGKRRDGADPGIGQEPADKGFRSGLAQRRVFLNVPYGGFQPPAPCCSEIKAEPQGVKGLLPAHIQCVDRCGD